MRVEFDFAKCIICLERSPGSWEHVIPRSLGGRLQARILCKKCNSELGSQIISSLQSDPSIRFAFENLKIVAEPGGAVALAAVLSGKIETRGRAIGLIVTGGNVDPGLFREILEG